MSLKSSSKSLSLLRELMRSKGIHAYIIPTEDNHQSEYIAACDQRRAFISDFTGSAGTAVVTLDKAALWTDGRYYLQASQQLSPSWILQKHGLKDTPTQEEWLVEVLAPASTVAVDPKIFTVAAAESLEKKLSEKGHKFTTITQNLVDEVWGCDRPAAPHSPVFVLDVKYAGVPFQEKVANIQKHLAEKKYWGLVVSALDEIAWLFNLRGSDIDFNPVFHSYALVTPDSAFLYVDPAKIDASVRAHLDKVVVKPYDAIFDDLKFMGASFASPDSEQKLLIDQKCSIALLNALSSKNYVKERSPIQTAKSIKNHTEQAGFRACHLRDAAALCRYFSWLETQLLTHNSTITESQGADHLESLRAKLDLFKGLSFDTISSTGKNGAVIHYKPDADTCPPISPSSLYLCDSGGQYWDGTTDVTRTLHFTTPTAEERDAFTRVLKGHIQLDMAVFPAGTTGYLLDILARTPLWRAGLDFRHGTGHGVGSFLNVHEGPQGISFRLSSNEVALQPGMTVTNEPGFYKDGSFGIRIENVMIVQARETTHQFGGVQYLGFEHVTFVPIQTKLIDKELLTREEVEWVNEYHRECMEKVGPLLDRNEDAYKWLERETRPI